jgi:hypothetical protein
MKINQVGQAGTWVAKTGGCRLIPGALPWYGINNLFRMRLAAVSPGNSAR